jgi:phosphoglycolate phosphatase
MLELIGIDLDGTIEDSRDDMVAAAARVRAALGLPARADAELRPHVNGGMDQLYRACFDDYASSPERYAEVRARYEADYLEHVADRTRMYEGMGEALSQLHRIAPIVCVTNKPERISRALLSALGVGELFRSVVGGDTCPHIKPHRVMLETAARRAGLDPERPVTACMIGDTQADIQLGRSFGAHTVWCAWGYVNALSQPGDQQALRPADLPAIVRSFS